MSKVYRAFNLLRKHEAEIHVGLGAIGGAYVVASKAHTILDLGLFTAIGAVVGYFPILFWGVAAGITYDRICSKSKKDKD